MPTGTVPEEHHNEHGVGVRMAAIVSFVVASVLSVIHTLNTMTLINQLYLPWTSKSSKPSPHAQYNIETCGRLDSEFEFESPPDFTTLGIELWTECRPVGTVEGWKVEHCTA